MKKKLYKYKWVYWLIILITIIYSISFNYATYTRIKYYPNYLRKFNFHNFLILFIGLISLITLFFLLKKNNYSIKLFNIINLSILGLLTLGFILKNFVRDSKYKPEDDDFIFFSIFTFLFSFFIFINTYFKFKENNNFQEIDEIGKKEQ